MVVDTASIKSLRDETGAGIMDCKRALEEAQGDIEKAQKILKQKGISIAAKKAHRETSEGLIESYVHSGNRIGSLVELNCETDFVARTPEFKNLAHDLAMQIAAMAPQYIGDDDIPDDLNGNPQEVVLLQQPFIKDPVRTVQDLVNDVIARVGENVRVRRFSRFVLGE